MSKTWNPHDGDNDNPPPPPNSAGGVKHAKDSERADWEDFFAFLQANATPEDAISVGNLDDILGE